VRLASVSAVWLSPIVRSDQQSAPDGCPSDCQISCVAAGFDNLPRPDRRQDVCPYWASPTPDTAMDTCCAGRGAPKVRGATSLSISFVIYGELAECASRPWAACC
jgi:hypothetical protein